MRIGAPPAESRPDVLQLLEGIHHDLNSYAAGVSGRWRSPRRAPLRCSSGLLLLHSTLHDAANQRVWNWFIQREPEIPLLSAVRRQRRHQPRVTLHRRIDADVILESGKIEEH